MSKSPSGSTTDSSAAAPTRPGNGRAVVEEPGRGPMVRVENLHRSYGSGAAAVHALRGV
ncbi:ABC transporter ATP-binding protein, partial [Streptomyces sp. NPDC001970]